MRLELDEHGRWAVLVPGEGVTFFTYRHEAYGPALLAAYRVSTLESLDTY